MVSTSGFVIGVVAGGPVQYGEGVCMGVWVEVSVSWLSPGVLL